MDIFFLGGGGAFPTHYSREVESGESVGAWEADQNIEQGKPF